MSSSTEGPVYPVAETFTSVQGEGTHTGTLMTFVRMVGCSVGKLVCNACDTDFDKSYPWRGGGMFHAEAIARSVRGHHVCLTGGEPLNQPLERLIRVLCEAEKSVHVETSGTVLPPYIDMLDRFVWITVSPKPGYLREMIDCADEIKVIVPGLGTGVGWPGLEQAKAWAAEGKTVYLQPRNSRNTVDAGNLQLVLQLIDENPELRLSAQLHKYINVR